MNEQWDKQRTAQCAIDRKMLTDVHLVICGDDTLGIIGIKDIVPELRKDVDELKLAKSNTMTIGKAAGVLGGFIGGIALVAGAIVAVIELIHNWTKS